MNPEQMECMCLHADRWIDGDRLLLSNADSDSVSRYFIYDSWKNILKEINGVEKEKLLFAFKKSSVPDGAVRLSGGCLPRSRSSTRPNRQSGGME